ncbi:MAG: formylglycine-generating enzyme family protein [Planctomycetota bacterium]
MTATPTSRTSPPAVFLSALCAALVLPAACGGSGGGDGGAAAGSADAPAAGAPAAGAADGPAAIGKNGFDAYSESIGDTGVRFDMVPVPGGTFQMGSPADEPGRGDDEGPQIEVTVSPFWMARCEITWAEYDTWNTDDSRPQSKRPDGMARPTPPYMDMTFNMGRDGYPAICMSHVAARQYCRWLSEKTGHFYRLPTEAEWEYACRAGSQAAYSVDGDSEAKLAEVAWYAGNCARVLQDGASPEPAYHPVGQLLPNAFGLHDMHGNVAEWVMDSYHADAYGEAHGKPPRTDPMMGLLRNKRGRLKRYPNVARGGSWQSAAKDVRSAARLASESMWNDRDPQIPKSWWYLTDGQHVGFRVVRPLQAPSAEERERIEKP